MTSKLYNVVVERKFGDVIVRAGLEQWEAERELGGYCESDEDAEYFIEDHRAGDVGVNDPCA